MKKVLLKIAVCIVVFFATILISSSLYNQGNADMTTTMESATLPLVYMTTGGISFNTLHGYCQEMDGKLFHLFIHAFPPLYSYINPAKAYAK